MQIYPRVHRRIFNYNCPMKKIESTDRMLWTSECQYQQVLVQSDVNSSRFVFKYSSLGYHIFILINPCSRDTQTVICDTCAGVWSQTVVGMFDSRKSHTETRQAAATLRPRPFLQPLSPSAPCPHIADLQKMAVAVKLQSLNSVCGPIERLGII